MAKEAKETVKGIYLARRGQVAGPFTVDALEKMRASGEIENYTFIWEDGAAAWKPLETAPPPPGRGGERDTSVSWNEIEAVCHNAKDVITGHLENIGDGGCELVSQHHSDSPKLALRSSVLLNVVDKAADKAVNVQASLAAISRRGGAWVYHLRWSRRPSLG